MKFIIIFLTVLFGCSSDMDDHTHTQKVKLKNNNYFVWLKTRKLSKVFKLPHGPGIYKSTID